MTPVPVLHIINGFEDASISWIVYRMIQHLGTENFTWHVAGLCGLGTMKEEFKRLEVNVIDFSQPSSSQPRILQRIRKYIHDHDIRIIHTHTPRTIFHAFCAAYRRPQIIHLTTKHLLHVPKDRRWGLMYTLFDRFTLYLPDHLVAVSEKMQRQISAYPGLSEKCVTVIRNAIECDQYYVPDQRTACRSEFGLTRALDVIGYTGRLTQTKSIDILLEAFSGVLRQFPESKLVIIGEGGIKPAMESLANQMGIAHAVVWTGFRKDIPSLLAAIDIYVQPSINEGLSLSLLEAMAAGKPVIATNVGGTSEVVKDGETGVLIPPGSPMLLQSAIADLLINHKKRSALAEVGRSFVVREFDVPKAMKAYRQLYEKLTV